MIIVNAETGTETNLRNLLRLFPRLGSTANPSQGIRTAWADPPTAEQLASVGYQHLVETEQPTPGPGEQVTAAPHALVAGQWERAWTVEAIPVEIPESVPAHHLRRALRAFGMLPAVVAYMAALPEDDEMRESWEYAPHFRRDALGIEAARVALGLSVGQVDALFRAAGQIIT